MAHKVSRWIKETDHKIYKISILGGELFQKELLDKMFKYFEFCRIISTTCGKDVTFNFVSNLSFDRDIQWHLSNLLQSTGATLSTSWDFAYRNTHANNFHNNIEYFKKRLSMITFVLTRPTIREMLSGKSDEYFRWLTENFIVQWDYYTPNEFANIMMPSDKDIYMALCYLIDNFPELPQSKALRYTGTAKTSCLSPNKITFLPNGENVACRYIDYDQAEFKTPINRKNNDNIITSFINLKGCLSCEYYKRCPLSCFVMSDNKIYQDREELDECLYKKLFDKYKPNI